MLRSSPVRFLLCAICFVAIIQVGVFESAQVQAQNQPPGPPGEEGDDAPPGRRARRASQRGTETKAKARPKFESLLEEKDLSYFRGYETEEIGDGWEIVGKSLHLNGEGGDLITIEEYDNFELRFDFKVAEGGNSGVMYRVSLGDDASYVSGPEFQILDDKSHDDGKNEMTSVGALYGMYAPKDKKSRDAGVWNSVKIIVNGDSVKHYLNGAIVVDAKLGSDDWNERLAKSKFKDWDKYGKNKSGHIAFQDHGDEVWFRKIMVKRLADLNEVDERRSSKMSKMKQMQMGVGGPPAEGDVRKKRGKQPDPKGGKGKVNSKLKKMQSTIPGSGPGKPPGGGE